MLSLITKEWDESPRSDVAFSTSNARLVKARQIRPIMSRITAKATTKTMVTKSQGRLGKKLLDQRRMTKYPTINDSTLKWVVTFTMARNKAINRGQHFIAIMPVPTLYEVRETQKVVLLRQRCARPLPLTAYSETHSEA
jgi:hypothetical protein